MHIDDYRDQCIATYTTDRTDIKSLHRCILSETDHLSSAPPIKHCCECGFTWEPDQPDEAMRKAFVARQSGKTQALINDMREWVRQQREADPQGQMVIIVQGRLFYVPSAEWETFIRGLVVDQ